MLRLLTAHLPWLRPRTQCLLCKGPTEGSVPLCHDCEADLPWLTQQCCICALPLLTEGLPCGGCLKQPPPFDQVVAAWRYDFPVDTLITRFKHQSRWPFGRLLAEKLATHVRHAVDGGLPKPDVLLPVPLAAKRLRQRGFNQAHMIADCLGKALQLPVEPQWLLRIHDDPAQQGLDAAARKKNLRRSFTLSPKASVQGKHVAVVDDVLTTGSTAETLARLLKRAGAQRVDVYCLARTPKPGR
ncbi:ComF family protein [Pseudomonas matsuisoli]|uniref:Amidophosphoribosyltransferase n=1 Tax=Pseudomonas matsuisoli TaxID=1515666 RepID=A0A917Q157_9PSED|nr:ComF family protein [Pseudomonas matsuisoli]GGK04512.1 amidophosphoribosyltransferase [Pseudomonas matsuisoli]